MKADIICIDNIFENYLLRCIYKGKDERYEAILTPSILNNGIIYGDATIEKTVKRQPGKNPISRLIAKMQPEKTEYLVSTNLGKDGLYEENTTRIEPGLEDIKKSLKERAELNKVQLTDDILDKTFEGFEEKIEKMYEKIKNPTLFTF